jgi:hypothetical protein
MLKGGSKLPHSEGALSGAFLQKVCSISRDGGAPREAESLQGF